ncbi:MAG: hypothetical protein QXU99_06210 [Candidatus Bathyarchaeia archaeon]
MPIVNANPVIPRGSVAEPIPPSIDVQSPLEGQRLNAKNGVWLTFKVNVPLTSWGSVGTSFGNVTSVRFILDQGQEQQLYLDKADEHGVIRYSLNLGQLSSGKHTIEIIVEGLAYHGTATHDFYFGSTPSLAEAMPKKLLNNTVQISFTVEGGFNALSVSPSVHVLSPENKTYETTQVPLNFTINVTASHTWYVLDSGISSSFVGNITLPELPAGTHSLTVYAIDTAKNWLTPQTVKFEIASNATSTQQSFPATFVIALLVATFVVGVVLLIYFKKHKQEVAQA